MSDLIHVLPDFITKPYSHILPSLEKALITTNDLLTLDAVDVARRASVPPVEVQRLTDEVLKVLHGDLGIGIDGGNDNLDEVQNSPEWSTVSTLDDKLDESLGGGFPTGYASAAGKTQLLLSLLLAVQLPPPHGLSKSALYISTEAPLQTKRLAQILEQHPQLSSLPTNQKPSLSRVQSTQLHDLEAQEHILRFQVPVEVSRRNIGLVVLDSVAANFRAEFDNSKGKKSAEALSERSKQLLHLGALLRRLARSQNIVVVVANQVLDRFTPAAMAFDYASNLSQRSGPSTHEDQRPTSMPVPSQTQPTLLSTNDPLSLDHQQRFFTGWGDTFDTRNQKTPSLGLTWTSQIAARIVLLKEPILKPQDYLLGPGSDIVGWRRHMKIAFASWCCSDNGSLGTRFEIWEGGIRALGEESAGVEEEGAGSTTTS
ncbi:hypothetical protein BT93_L5228 [Corymbia citriodora subsp. variegata]|uniref:RecA family profile 1 domain-containing protein n=1 Tax=Corymbia citriodora subsp. variegata TaxID=360336 RepID=A0A8T0CFE1_CORYI|nr:hypothetical protein BT93_L5228 [Corymbia citriodora subsp. variegata]